MAIISMTLQYPKLLMKPTLDFNYEGKAYYIRHVAHEIHVSLRHAANIRDFAPLSSNQMSPIEFSY